VCVASAAARITRASEPGSHRSGDDFASLFGVANECGSFRPTRAAWYPVAPTSGIPIATGHQRDDAVASIPHAV